MFFIYKKRCENKKNVKKRKNVTRIKNRKNVFTSVVETVAARGCLPPGANAFVAAPPPQSADLQLIFLWLQRWH